MSENTKIWAETRSSLNIWSWIERVCLNDKNSEFATRADNNWSRHWARHLKWVCYNDKLIVDLLIKLVIRKQVLLHACSRHERNKLYYMRVVNVNRTSFIKCDRHKRNKLCYMRVVGMNQKWVCFKDAFNIDLIIKLITR